MTRLRPGDVAGIVPAALEKYDRELVDRTGCTLAGLACRAAGLEERELRERAAGLKTAVVPVDGGLGRIGGFAESVAAIAAHLGFPAAVTAAGDVAGVAEALETGCGLLLMSDDVRFVAIHPASRRVVDNAPATGRGFAVGLALMAGGVGGRPVLLLGCGPVGRAAADALLEEGARLTVHDPAPARARALAEEAGRRFGAGVRVEPALEAALSAHELILDATPSAGFIRERHVTPRTIISAPGVPLGLAPDARRAVGNRLLHDPLQTGVAVMLAQAVRREAPGP